jgi:hypothetical protein
MSFEDEYREYAEDVRRRLGNPACKMCGADDDKAMEWIDAYNREVEGVILCSRCCQMAAEAFALKHGDLPWTPNKGDPAAYRKAKISRTLSKQVLERDGYRCVTCGTHLDLSCDHIIPESKGGPTTFENLQAMCRTCNSKKGAREA